MSGTITGSSPNWVAGYVPPAAEWNQWWAKKMDADSSTFAGGPFLSLEGGTMTGALYLPSALPVDPHEAVNKGYVDSLTFAAGPFMPAAGGTFTGPVIHTSSLTLAGNPSQALDAAPKQYVDNATNQANNALNVANAAVRRAGDTMTGLLTLSSDPVAANNAATKSYADLKVAKTGDTMTGRLTVSSDMVVTGPLYNSGTLYINAYNSWEWGFGVNPTNGDHIQTYRTGWYDAWQSSGGARFWVGGSVSLMGLDGSGNLNVKAQMAAGSVFTSGLTVGTAAAGGNATIYGTVTAGALAMGPWVFYNSGDQIQQHTAGWYERWETNGGARSWVNGNIETLRMDSGGNLAILRAFTAGAIISNNQVDCKGTLYADNQQMVFGKAGLGRIMQMQGNWYWEFDVLNGNMAWIADRNPAVAFWVMRPGDAMCFNSIGAVGGIGAYVPLSDMRSKRDAHPATCGLDEILAIEPIEFDRIDMGGASPGREIGFSAQQMKSVLPLSVRNVGIRLPDGTGGIDSDEPTMGVMLDPIVAALVNGMKALASEVAALKAGR